MNINIIFDGLSLGAIYALIALGYTMVYGIAKMLNFAHGDVIMVGAYTLFVTMNLMGNPVGGLRLPLYDMSAPAVAKLRAAMEEVGIL